MDTAEIPKSMAFVRLGYAATAFLMPRLATILIGLKPSEVTPVARAWARFFATREAALGAVTLGTEDGPPEVRRQALLLNAAVDGADTVAALLLAKRHRSLRSILLLAVPVGAASVVAHLREAQRLGSQTTGA